MPLCPSHTSGRENRLRVQIEGLNQLVLQTPGETLDALLRSTSAFFAQHSIKAKSLAGGPARSFHREHLFGIETTRVHEVVEAEVQ